MKTPDSLKRLVSFFLKPVLPYMELHLTDHCNLNCKGCDHFSPLARHKNANIEQYREDIYRLKKLFRNIGKIRLMGGEPLLHPHPEAFVFLTRKAFPRASIHFVTNGILLPKANKEFWHACRKTDTVIDISVYPPNQNNVTEWCDLCAQKNVKVVAFGRSNNGDLSDEGNVQVFLKHMNINGTSDKNTSFTNCRKKFNCPFLHEGKLYTCMMPALVHYFNDAFGYQISTDGGIDIHQKVTGKQIVEHLSKPIETCRWCSHHFTPFTWGISRKLIEDWATENE